MIAAYSAAFSWSICYVWQRLLIRKYFYYGTGTFNERGWELTAGFPTTVRLHLSYRW